MAELRASIVGEFKGKKAFKDAEKATSKLDKGVKRLGASLLAAFSVQKLATFSKNAVKAFAENEKSAKRLETVVKNLGLAFEIPGIEASLDKVSAKFGYEGEVLREAFQKLITTTGSAKKSQDLLNLSLDIAAGSGVDLLTVNQDLAAAYVGQTRGLRKYNLGLTQSELKTLDFDSAVSKLSANFKGAGGAELETFSGKMRVLQEGAENAQEIIGGGLVDALLILSGDTTVEELAATMGELATNTAEALTNLGKFGQGVKDVIGPIATGFEKFINATQPFFNSIVFGDALTFAKPSNVGRARRSFGGGSGGAGGNIADNIARRKAEEIAAKRARELAALQKKTLDTQKKSLAEAKKKTALDKASKTLNLEAIGIEAALKGKISETDRLSLQLQKAILEGNATLATQLSDQLEAAIKRNAQLQAALLATPKAPNPYEDWKIPADLLNYTAVSLGVSTDTVINKPQNIPAQTSDATQELAAAVGAASNAQDKLETTIAAIETILSIVASPFTTAGSTLANEDLRGRSGAITVNVQGSVVTEKDLQQVIIEAVNQASSSGIRVGNFDRIAI
jgi:hypothetical protein